MTDLRVCCACSTLQYCEIISKAVISRTLLEALCSVCVHVSFYVLSGWRLGKYPHPSALRSQQADLQRLWCAAGRSRNCSEASSLCALKQVSVHNWLTVLKYKIKDIKHKPVKMCTAVIGTLTESDNMHHGDYFL